MKNYHSYNNKIIDILIILSLSWDIMIEKNIQNIFKASKTEIFSKDLKIRNLKNFKKGKKYKTLKKLQTGITYNKYGKNIFFLEKYKSNFGKKPDSKIRYFFLKKNISKENFGKFLNLLTEEPWNGDKNILEYKENDFIKIFQNKREILEKNLSEGYIPWGYTEKKKELFIIKNTISSIINKMIYKIENKNTL